MAATAEGFAGSEAGWQRTSWRQGCSALGTGGQVLFRSMPANYPEGHWQSAWNRHNHRIGRGKNWKGGRCFSHRSSRV